MPEFIKAGPIDKTTELMRIAESMLNICDVEFQEVLDTLTTEWQGDAAKLFVNRMDILKEDIIRDSTNLLYNTNEAKF